MQWDLNAENTLQSNQLPERTTCGQTYTSDGGEGVCAKLKTSMHPPGSTQETTMKWKLEFPVNSKSIFQIKGGTDGEILSTIPGCVYNK